VASVTTFFGEAGGGQLKIWVTLNTQNSQLTSVRTILLSGRGTITFDDVDRFDIPYGDVTTDVTAAGKNWSQRGARAGFRWSST
jgi:hypothetical protein